jgi:hypothetical protein
LEQPNLYETLYVPVELLGIHPVGGSDAADYACAVGQFWTDRVREMMDTGYFQKGDPGAVSITLWAHGHGLVSLYHRGLLPGLDEAGFRHLLYQSYAGIMRGLAMDRYLDYLLHDAPEPAGTAFQSTLQDVAGADG